MSILTAMYSGVSGLNAEGEALGIVGDNVANTSTIGFKQSRATFEDVLGSAMGAHATGAGVRMTRAQQIFAQGTLLTTGQSTDVALSGDGFFVVDGMVNGSKGTYFTRAGQATVDRDGYLVNPQGLKLQGYQALPNGTFAAATSSLQLPTAAISPNPTTEFKVTANLDATSTPPTLPWDPLNPSTTSNFSTSMRVYDSLGNGHSIDVYFRNTGPGTWEAHALAAGSEVVGGIPGQNFEIGMQTLTFTNTGALQNVAPTTASVNFVGAAAGQTISFNYGNPIASGGTGLDGTTGFGSPSNVSAQSQNGYSSGDLSGVKVEADGTVRGVYTNGQQIPVGKLAVAKFRSVDGLGRAGQNVWTATRESGDPAIGEAGSGGRAAVVSGALEQSNVDIAQQFVELIAHQRSFQANSKTITTANDMLQEVVNLKR